MTAAARRVYDGGPVTSARVSPRIAAHEKKIQVIPYSLGLRILWGARRRRLASTVLTYPVDMLARRESVSRRNFSLERPGGPHQQSKHPSGRASRQRTASRKSNRRTIALVAALQRRDSAFEVRSRLHRRDAALSTQVKGADKSLASEHCTCACPTFAPVPYVPPPPPGQD